MDLPKLPCHSSEHLLDAIRESDSESVCEREREREKERKRERERALIVWARLASSSL